MKDSEIKYECVKMVDKILFEEYISKQLKLDLMLKMYPASFSIYMENCPTSPTSDDIITEAQKLYDFIMGETNVS